MKTNDSPTAATGGQSPEFFYKQALDMFARALLASARARFDHSALEESLRWARQAEQIGSVLQERTELKEVNAAYVQLIMHCALKSQELALTSGNIFSYHGPLASIAEQAADSLVNRIRLSNKEIPLAVALVIQGHARELNSRVSAIVNDKHNYVTSAEKLDKVLESLAQIIDYSIKLTDLDEATVQPLGQRVLLAATAVSNARYLLCRFFSQKLSDWDKAQILCNRAYLLLTRRPLSNAAQHQPSGDQHMDAALRDFPAAYAALLSKNYKTSAQLLETVCDNLKRASAR
jgi:hypothetical protein